MNKDELRLYARQVLIFHGGDADKAAGQAILELLRECDEVTSELRKQEAQARKDRSSRLTPANRP